MKRLTPAVILCLLCSSLAAQTIEVDPTVIANEDSCDVASIQSAIDACLKLAESASTHDTAGLIQAKDSLLSCGLGDFGTLRREGDREAESLNGHLIFCADFADMLAEGKDPYQFSDKITRTVTNRGQMAAGQILTKTCFVKANGTSVYSFISHDRQELAVVAEPGGLVTTRVHAMNKDIGVDEWHNDTVDVDKGRNSRKAAFTLPSEPPTQVILEIRNCTDKDISVVVISN